MVLALKQRRLEPGGLGVSFLRGILASARNHSIHVSDYPHNLPNGLNLTTQLLAGGQLSSLEQLVTRLYNTSLSRLTHCTTRYNWVLLYQEVRMRKTKKAVRVQMPVSLAVLRELQRYYVVILVGGK